MIPGSKVDRRLVVISSVYISKRHETFYAIKRIVSSQDSSGIKAARAVNPFGP